MTPMGRPQPGQKAAASGICAAQDGHEIDITLKSLSCRAPYQNAGRRGKPREPLLLIDAVQPVEYCSVQISAMGFSARRRHWEVTLCSVPAVETMWRRATSSAEYAERGYPHLPQCSLPCRRQRREYLPQRAERRSLVWSVDSSSSHFRCRFWQLFLGTFLFPRFAKAQAGSKGKGLP